MNLEFQAPSAVAVMEEVGGETSYAYSPSYNELVAINEELKLQLCQMERDAGDYRLTAKIDKSLIAGMSQRIAELEAVVGRLQTDNEYLRGQLLGQMMMPFNGGTSFAAFSPPSAPAGVVDLNSRVVRIENQISSILQAQDQTRFKVNGVRKRQPQVMQSEVEVVEQMNQIGGRISTALIEDNWVEMENEGVESDSMGSVVGAREVEGLLHEPEPENPGDVRFEIGTTLPEAPAFSLQHVKREPGDCESFEQELVDIGNNWNSEDRPLFTEPEPISLEEALLAASAVVTD